MLHQTHDEKGRTLGGGLDGASDMSCDQKDREGVSMKEEA